MAILELPTIEPLYDVTLLPNRRKWTRAEVHRFYEAGIFNRNDRLELLYGELVRKEVVTPPRGCAMLLLGAVLRTIFGLGFVVRTQLSLVVDEKSEPEQTVAIVCGQPRDYLQEHPSQALLVVEVSDATLAYDLGGKAALYAQAGVEDYWVVDINARLVHVHRRPVASASLPNGYGYQTVTRLTETDQVSPLAAPGNSFQVAEILP